MKKLLPLLLSASLLCSCSPEPEKPKDFQQLSNRILTPDESFNLIWAEVIAKTEAINQAAKAIIDKENLQPGDKLPPSRLGIINTPENNTPGDKPYDALLEARIDHKTCTFWIHVEDTVQEQGVTTAIACAIKPPNKGYYFYPKTSGTQALMNLSLDRLRNDQTQMFLYQWQESQKKPEDNSKVLEVKKPNTNP